jgi:predicted transglutaminase-like cysteine proteinase
MAPRHCCWLIVFAAIALNACSQSPAHNSAAFALLPWENTDRVAVESIDGPLGRGVAFSRKQDPGPMPRWDRVIMRFSQQERSPDPACLDSARANCPAEIWKQLVAQIRALPLRARIEMVNNIFNRVPYVPAEVNWHDVAYWETPYEFLARGGQCQDYAIAKYLALLESGVPETALRFVVVHDNQVQLDHAITLVDVDGVSLALDNQLAGVTPAEVLRQRYSPYYALNGQGWWSYMSPSAMPVAWQPATANPAALFVSSFRVARY